MNIESKGTPETDAEERQITRLGEGCNSVPISFARSLETRLREAESLYLKLTSDFADQAKEFLSLQADNIRLREALNLIVADTEDYIKINNLGKDALGNQCLAVAKQALNPTPDKKQE